MRQNFLYTEGKYAPQRTRGAAPPQKDPRPPAACAMALPLCAAMLQLVAVVGGWLSWLHVLVRPARSK